MATGPTDFDPIYVYAGEDRILTLTIKVNGVLLDLTAYTLTCMVKLHDSYPDTAAVITKTSTNTPGGIVFANQTASPGSATLTISGADTVGKSGRFRLGLKLFPGAIVEGQGPFIILQPIVQTITAP